MYRLTGMCLVFLFTFAVSSQTINLKGTVSNSSGKPIVGAIVKLAKQKKADTTNAQGVYEITGGTAVVQPSLMSQVPHFITLEKSVLFIHTTEAMPISVDLFDMRGQLLDQISENSATPGDYTFDIARHQLGAKMMVVRVTAGSEMSQFRYLPIATGRQKSNSSSPARQSTMLAKAQAVVDTIKVTATGFSAKSVAIESLQGEKNITLDSSSSAEYFSFFITSMKGLQELAKNEKGFGGDLRFGKTGQGAGLLGADSICQCLAEKSMPGSKAKQWRAFLSAKSGVDGKQVNAIDRIGNGPWYDRLQRIVAESKSDLLNDRPKGMDPDIINDFPNEFGVQNHRPDPTKPVVDNHLTITGSNTKGELYTGDEDGGMTMPGMGNPGSSTTGWTCDDWTSTTSKANPRAGMSWPQSAMMGGMGMKNWISVWNMSGCEAGYDLETSTGAGKPNVYTIGNGGGYGGFYCFALKP